MREILLKLNKKILGNILNVIYNSPLGVTIEDIVNSTGHHRVTVQRYITRLEELGFVKLKRIGHYVLVFPANLIKQIENDFPSLLLDSTIHVIQKNLKLNHINLFEIGKELGEAISDEIINDVKEYFRKIGDKIYEFTNIFLPATTFRFKIKVNRFSLSDKLITIEINYLNKRKSSLESFCYFMGGYIEGILCRIIGIRKIEIIDMVQNENNFQCKYIAILDKPISEYIARITK